jgi:type I restriction enzyme S subunit
MNVIENLPIPIPPLLEQKAIVDYFDRETGKIDTLVQKIETAVEKLREYRVSLISSVVTGKIDVRDLKI